MKKLATLITAALLLATPAYAIVGGGTPQTDGAAHARSRHHRRLAR
ncbi:hypothetical protein ACVWW3_007092 [Bradyrhizobium sp. LM2.9]